MMRKQRPTAAKQSGKWLEIRARAQELFGWLAAVGVGGAKELELSMKRGLRVPQVFEECSNGRVRDVKSVLAYADINAARRRLRDTRDLLGIYQYYIRPRLNLNQNHGSLR